MREAFWILLWGLSCCECQRAIVISPPVTTSECSTWGNYNFQTFDGSQFSFPGTCFYLFASDCISSHSAFNIVVRRSISDEGSTIFFSATLDDILIEVKDTGITVKGQVLNGSFSEKSVFIEQDCAYLIMTSKLGVALRWNYNDLLLLNIEDTFTGRTCGLCGSYDGSKDNDFIINGVQLSSRQFGNQQKINMPTESCPDVPADGVGSSGVDQCTAQRTQCEATISSFGNCTTVLPANNYVTACTNDVCTCASSSPLSCACGTLNLYSRNCVLAGGNPGDWRQADLCYRSCPDRRVYMECGSPCPNTCSNPVRTSFCNSQCTDGCFCPSGMILDDVMNTGCVNLGQCPCNYKGKYFASGDYFSTACQTCSCSNGQWNCTSQPCSRSCELLGGSHVSTFDGKDFTFHGNCLYIISMSNDEYFTILGELSQCGVSSTVTCLNTVTLALKYKVIKVCHCGSVYVNGDLVQLPFSDADLLIFKSSTDFISVQSTLQLQMDIQLTPTMQLFLSLDSGYKGQVSGLCGNFNDLQGDDLRTATGVVENSPAAFANSWMTQATCQDSKDNVDDPCITSPDKKQYAEHGCSLLNGDVFAPCSMYVDATPFYKNCMYDTCNSESSEDALLSILSAYTKSCTDQGVVISDWKSLITDPSANCPKSMVFSSTVRYCNTTCRSLTEWDSLCDVVMTPVQGCGCPEDTYLDSYNMCVRADSCTCLYKDDIISPGITFQEGLVTCKCIRGKIECIGVPQPIECTKPMQFFDCSTGGANAVGSECQKSCTTQNTKCHSTKCISGCVCPDGLVIDGNGGCIPADRCPCMRNGNAYQPGENFTVGCNTCTCQDRMWTCTDNPCAGSCSVYGSGHFLSFDGSQFDFKSNCDYILAQDFCPNNPNTGTFRVISEITSCGSTSAICSMTIRIKIANNEIRLLEGQMQMVHASREAAAVSYQLSVRGLYYVVTTSNGATIMWDQKTTVSIKLEASFMGIVCGLCGNFDGSGNNDFTTLGQSIESSAQNFGNSWKVTKSCPNVVPSNPCSGNPYREVWAQRYCSIIKSDLFKSCHLMVNPVQFYDSCVHDSCSCDSGGDCECFCTAVAAYAQACNQAGVCVDWRTPEVCPTFCDYYNPEGECSWHYKPCGSPCLKTCTNPRALCTDSTYTLEGCYPKCHGKESFFDENLMTCVSAMNCTACTSDEMLCSDDMQDCLCCYGGKTYKPHEEIYNTGDGINCLTATCGAHGQILRRNYLCGETTTKGASTTVTSKNTQHPALTTPGGSGLSTSSIPDRGGHTTTTPGNAETTATTPSKNGNSPTTPLHGGNNTPSSSSHTSTTTHRPAFTATDASTTEPSKNTSGGSALSTSSVPDRGGHTPTTPGNAETTATTPSQNGNSPTTPLHGGNNTPSSSSHTSTTTNRPAFTATDTFTTAHSSRNTNPNFPTTTLGGALSSSTTQGNGHNNPTTPGKVDTTETTPGRQGNSPTTHRSNGGNTPSPSSLASRTTTKQPGLTATGCLEEECYWSGWFDNMQPKLTNSGDYETIETMRAKNSSLCTEPRAIDCRAVQVPEVSLASVAQIVTCNLVDGLVCNNADQELPLCYNYKVRIQCCSVVSCATEGPVPSSPESVTTVWVTNNGSNPTAVNTGSNDVSCTCVMPNGTRISKGSVISHFVDAENWCFTSTCNASCEIEEFRGVCPTSAAPHPSPGSSATSAAINPPISTHADETTTTSIQQATITRAPSADCTDLTPPRRFMESWDYGNCITAICLGDRNRIKLVFAECADPSPVSCPNNIPTIRIYEETSCCYSYACQSCVTGNGTQRAPGETWQENCQDFTCNSLSLDISVVPHPCAEPAPIVCTRDGEVATRKPLSSDPCCTENVCVCDLSKCNSDLAVCNPGFQLKITFPPQSCCPNYTCVPKNVCVSNGVEYLPGAVVPSSSCNECNCTDTRDPLLQTNKILCSPIVCIKDCQPGFTYVDAVGRCCGVCKQTACAVSFPSGIITIQPNSNYQEPGNNCTLYKCINSNGQLALSTVEMNCPDFNPDNCIAGTIGRSPDGCCDTCLEKSQGCKMKSEWLNISNDNCTTLEPIEVHSCQGACSSSYTFSPEVGQTLLRCSCCRDLEFHVEEITLFCPDSNTTTPYKYTFIDQCGCSPSPCN
ncbi:mucin-5B-like [Ambystoma mexicanum]|uniref:mucin-5B-like n=1 Tax=Ambystoma mexicanum TaxID=8296 RepID=UPI0037E7F993